MQPYLFLPQLLRAGLSLPGLRMRTFATASPLRASRAPLYATASEARLLTTGHLRGNCVKRKELLAEINSRGRVGTKSITMDGSLVKLVFRDGHLFAKQGWKAELSAMDKKMPAKDLRNGRKLVDRSKQSNALWGVGSNNRKPKGSRAGVDL